MAGHKNRRENFLKCGLTYLLLSLSAKMIFWGDLNCVLTNNDCTENMKHKEALEKFVTSLVSVDV